MKDAEAENLARDALVFIAGDDRLARRFLDETGTAPEAVRRRAAEPDFLAAVLDFLLADERRLTAFAEAAGIDPARPARARAALPGGAPPHWT